jgi:hypothetical protein
MTLTPEDIGRIVAEFIAKRKHWEARKKSAPINAITKEREKVSQYPEYWHGYNYAAKLYDSIMPHARPDVYPEHLLSVRAPNQTEAQAQYIKANYKPVTLNVFEDFKNTVSRAFADQNWSVAYRPEADERFGQDTFSKYVSEQIRIYGSIEAFVKAMLPTLKLTDANGIIAIEPSNVEEVVEMDGEGNMVQNNNLVAPMPKYYNCKAIVAQQLGEYYMVVSDDRSKVKVGSKEEREGLVLLLFDDVAIYRIEQTGKRDDYTFNEPYIVYQHDLGYVPCTKLMGTPMLIHNEVVYQSPFITSVPLLDQVVLDESYLQMSKATSAFPFMVALGEICDFTDSDNNVCDNGRIMDAVNGGYRSCPACNGSGVRSRFSPSGMLLVRPKTSTSEGDSGLSGEYLKFVSPPMDTLKFLREEIDQAFTKARQVLHLPNADSAVTANEGQTATGSLNKLRALHAFLKPISDQLFSVWEFIINTTGRMRYGEYYGGATLVYPTSFDINTPTDYLMMIGESIKAGVPPAVTYMNVYNYIKAINYTDTETTAIYDLIVNADELLLMNSADIMARIANGTIEKWQDVLHQSAPQLIMELMREHVETPDAPRFIDLPLEQQIAALREKAVSKVREQLDPIQQVQQQLLNGLA